MHWFCYVFATINSLRIVNETNTASLVYVLLFCVICPGLSLHYTVLTGMNPVLVLVVCKAVCQYTPRLSTILCYGRGVLAMQACL